MLLRALFSICVASLLSFSDPADGQELRYREEPMSIDRMGDFAGIQFSKENFEKVDNGMTEEQVLSLLGRPMDLKKEHRRHDRWTAHYFYPESHVINFRNGLVVGKEKISLDE